jgi:glutathione S-transferase
MSAGNTDVQPLVLYGRHGPSPNPIKVAIILEELSLPWTLEEINMDQLKSEPYISINPNGRLPSLEDPNTGVKIFESGSIIEYLVETYDKDYRIHSSESLTQWLEKSWLFFQVSGQGPYFGQKWWFDRSHPEVKYITLC